MKTLPVFVVALLIHGSAEGRVKEANQESITVTIVGTIHSGIVAVGGETTGATVTSKGITWELDFRQDQPLRETAQQLNNRLVIVTGSLERRAGVEVKDRWIVAVTSLKAHD